MSDIDPDSKCTTLRTLFSSRRWMQHKDERATVGSLSKALFKADEYEAILVLQE